MPRLAVVVAASLAFCGCSGHSRRPDLPAAEVEGVLGSAVIGPAGGTVRTAEGASLTIPAGVLTQDVSVALTYMPPAVAEQEALAARLSRRLTAMGGLEVSLHGEPAQVPAKLIIPAAPPPPESCIALAAMRPDVDGDSVTDALLAGFARPGNGRLVASASADPTASPLRSELPTIGTGQHLFLAGPRSFAVRGTVPFARSIVTTFDSLEIKSLSQPDGAFLAVVAARPNAAGEQRVTVVAERLRVEVVREAVDALGTGVYALGAARVLIGGLVDGPAFPPVVLPTPIELQRIGRGVTAASTMLRELCRDPNFNKVETLEAMLDDVEGRCLSQLWAQMGSAYAGRIKPNPLWLEVGESGAVTLDGSNLLQTDIPIGFDLGVGRTLKLGLQFSIKAKVTYAQFRTVAFSVSTGNPSIAEVVGGGAVAVSKGAPAVQATIVGRAEGTTEVHASARRCTLSLGVEYSVTASGGPSGCQRRLSLSIKPSLSGVATTAFFRPGRARVTGDKTAYVIFHCHNPEGVEVASISRGVVASVYEGTRRVGHGAWSAAEHGVPVATTAGRHAYRALFNGIAERQTVNLVPGETKTVTFVFGRTELPTPPPPGIVRSISGTGRITEPYYGHVVELRDGDHMSGQYAAWWVHGSYAGRLKLRYSVDLSAQLSGWSYSATGNGWVRVTDVVYGLSPPYCRGAVLLSSPCSFSLPARRDFHYWFVQGEYTQGSRFDAVVQANSRGYVHDLTPGPYGTELLRADQPYRNVRFTYRRDSFLWAYLHEPRTYRDAFAESNGISRYTISSVPYDLRGTGVK